MTMRRGRRASTFVALLALGILMAFALPAEAVHDLTGGLELEGDTDNDTGTALLNSQVDWESFFNSSGNPITPLPTGFTASGFAADFAFPDPSAYATGSKDDLPISGWQCKKANNLGGKFDVINAYAAGFTYSGTGGQHLVVYFGVERAATEGSGNVGFWLLKDGAVDCVSNGGGTDFTGGHQDGDIFIVSEFTNGGANARIRAYRWNGGEGGSLSANPIVEGGKCGVGTEQTVNGRAACAIVNSAPLNTIWPSPDKSGGDLDTNAFFEGGVDLGTLADVGCFATFIANSRSSFEPGSTIHDYSRGAFAVCQPSTTLSATSNGATPAAPVIHAGNSITLTFTETNDGNTVLEKPASTNFVTTDNANCNPADVLVAGFNEGDTNQNGDLDPGEAWKFSCTFTPTADTTVVATGHGIDPLGRDVTFCTATTPDGTIVGNNVCDRQERTSISIDVTNPSTALSTAVTATFTFTETNDGDVPLTNPSVSATGCTVAPILDGGFNAGDTNDNGVLDPTEAWQFSCTVTRTTAGTTTVVGTGTGTDPLNFVITFCTTPPNGTTICDSQERSGGSVTLT